MKAVAVAENGTTLHSEQVHYELLKTAPGRSEQDPDTIVEACLQCLERLCKAVGKPPALVGLSSYMHGIMALDDNNKPLTPVILWSDTRSGAIARRLRQSPAAESIYLETGTPIHSMSPLCKIIWLCEHEPAAFQKAKRFLSIKEYLWFRLFGTFEIDASVASATGLYNLEQQSWNPQSLALCGLEPKQLSDIRPTTFQRTFSARECGPLADFASTSFCIGGSDGCMANLGSGVTAPGVAALTIGTSGAVRITTSTPLLRYPAMIFSYVLDEKRFVCGGPINNGGNVLQWLIKNFWGCKEDAEKAYDDFFRLIEPVPAGSEGLVFLPYVYGERAPVWDEEAGGVFLGIKAHHTTAHFLRAGLEGICMALRQVMELLEAASQPLHSVYISGGFIQSATWVQMLADVLNKPLVTEDGGDASAVGAALIAMQGAGWKRPDPEGAPSAKQVQPQSKNLQAYNKSFQVFRQIHQAVRHLEADRE